MLEWIKCDKTPLFAENLSEQLHSIARRVFCVGTLNFWKALERLWPPVGFERLGQLAAVGVVEEDIGINCHTSLPV